MGEEQKKIQLGKEEDKTASFLQHPPQKKQGSALEVGKLEVQCTHPPPHEQHTKRMMLKSYLKHQGSVLREREVENINSLQLCEHEIQIGFQLVTKRVVQNILQVNLESKTTQHREELQETIGQACIKRK